MRASSRSSISWRDRDRLEEAALTQVALQPIRTVVLGVTLAHEKRASILHKTWKKIAPVAREHALARPYSVEAKKLLEQAPE